MKGMSEQLALLDAGRVCRNDREAWELHEALYSRPEYAWPLVRYLRSVADQYCFRVEDQQAAQWASDAIAGPLVEPCVGGGAIVDGIQRYTGVQQVLCGDIRDVERANWIGDWRVGSVWDVRTAMPNVSVAAMVASNPPFSQAVEIVEASWERCPNAVVAILQRATWYEPTKDRGAWLREHCPDQVTIGRCEFFWPDGTSRGSGDTCSYTWYVFGPNREGLRGGHHCIIPWTEAPHHE